MDINKIIEEAEQKHKKQLDYLDSLSEEGRNELKAKELEVSYLVKELLDKKNIGISDISTHFYKDYILDNNEKIDAFHTVFTVYATQRARSVVTHAETMEMLYVRAGIKGLIPFNEYFNFPS